MSFECISPFETASYVIKISVGGVNALTGLPQNQSVEGKQDYIVVGGASGQNRKRIESLEIQMLDRIAYQTLLPSPAKSEEASQYGVWEKGARNSTTVHLNTPLNATSSPETIAESSFARTILTETKSWL